MAVESFVVSAVRRLLDTPLYKYLFGVALLWGMVWGGGLQAAQNLPFTLAVPFLNPPPPVLDVDDRQWLDTRQALRVGISIADFEPIDITSDRNRYQGVSADYLGLVGAGLGMPVQVTGYATREQAMEALQAGEIDMLTSANDYEKAFAGVVMSRSYLPDHAVVVGRGEDVGLTPSLAGKRVVILDGYADPALAHRTYPHSEIVTAPNLYSAMEALTQGDADAFIGNEIIVRAYAALRPYLGLQIKFDSKLPGGSFSFALREGDERLRVLVDRVLDGLDESVRREILLRWTAGLGVDGVAQRIGLNSAEQQWVRKHPEVIVASTQHPPYLYKDGGGRWVGLNADILARVSRMTGLSFVHVEMPSTEAVIDALGRGTMDMNTTLSDTTERRRTLDFTHAFGSNSWVFVVRSDSASPVSLAELSGQVLAMPARHALLEYIRERHPGIRLRLVPTYEAARNLVERGEARATIQNESGAWMYPRGGLKVGRSIEGKWSADRFSVIKSEPELLSILNKSLEAFPVEEMRAIRMKWLGAVMSQPPLWQRVPAWVYWILALALVLGLVSLAWSSRLQLQIRERRRVEVQLDDHLAFKQALLDGIPDPVYVRDLQGRLVSCNRSYEQALGISFEQMNGRRLIDVDLIPHDNAERLHNGYMQVLRTGQPVLTDCSMVIAGRRFEARQWTVPFYRADGELQGLLGGWLDLCERKRPEPEWASTQQREGPGLS